MAQLRINASLPGRVNNETQREDHSILLGDSERRAGGEDVLLGRHFGKTKSGAGCGWEGSFPLSRLMKGIGYGEFIFLGEMIVNVQREEFGLSWRVPFNT